MTTQYSERNHYFDFLRGIAILMVVGIHTYPHNHSLKGPVSDIIQLIAINFFCCAVPLFLAISGYFVSRKKLRTLSDARLFWYRQIPTVYIPCLIFSIPWLIINIISTNHSSLWISILYFFTCGYSIYYFIALIIECYIIAPLLLRYNNNSTLIIIIIISLLFTVLCEYIRFVQGIKLPLTVYCSLPMLLIFFYVGIYLNNHSRNYSLWLPVSLMILGLGLGLLHMQYIRDTFGVSAQGQKSSLYVFDIGFLLFCMSKKCENLYKSNLITRLILYIGEISFGIYFTHIYVIWIVDHYITSLKGNWILLWLFCVLVTVVIINFIKYLMPNFSKKYLGYR